MVGTRPARFIAVPIGWQQMITVRHLQTRSRSKSSAMIDQECKVLFGIDFLQLIEQVCAHFSCMLRQRFRFKHL